MSAPHKIDAQPHYGAITTSQDDDGWFFAEVQLGRLYPVQMGAGKSLETALANLERRMKCWNH